MKGSDRFKLLSVILIFAYLLSACSGVAPQSSDQTTGNGGKPQAVEVSFTGTVESISAGEITISGQTVTLDAKSVMDANVKVGDIVKVEAQVSENGAVLALKVESFGADDTNTNTSNTNDDTNVNSNTNDNSNASNENGNANGNDNTNTAGGVEQEVSGVVDAITADSITIDGVVYQFAVFTEFKEAIFAGDTVKLHVVINGDGTFTVREIEKTDGASIGNDNSNSNDDNGNDDNSNSNENEDDDDHSNGNGNGNGG